MEDDDFNAKMELLLKALEEIKEDKDYETIDFMYRFLMTRLKE